VALTRDIQAMLDVVAEAPEAQGLREAHERRAPHPRRDDPGWIDRAKRQARPRAGET
jgi:hypothetical protein